MRKSNGKSEVETHGLDVEHELPPADGDDTTSASNQNGAVAPEPTGVDAELQKVKAERDSLLDRLARAQAEFENARRRAAKEQQDFRDFAMADAIKSLLPVVDNFERALQSKSEPADFRAGWNSVNNCRCINSTERCSPSGQRVRTGHTCTGSDRDGPGARGGRPCRSAQGKAARVIRRSPCWAMVKVARNR